MILTAAIAAGSTTAAPPASATTGSEEKLAYYHNKARAYRDIDKLRLSQSLSDVARRHSRRMRDKGYIYHTSSLSYTLRDYDWDIAGENVGMGPSMYTLHKAFMASAGHKANILNKRFRRFGVGVAWDGDLAFVTVIFMDY